MRQEGEDNLGTSRENSFGRRDKSLLGGGGVTNSRREHGRGENNYL
jgi:hypothetical protein